MFQCLYIHRRELLFLRVLRSQRDGEGTRGERGGGVCGRQGWLQVYHAHDHQDGTRGMSSLSVVLHRNFSAQLQRVDHHHGSAVL